MPEIITYRKSNVGVFWHLYPTCRDWPTKDYEEITSDHPPFGGFCTDCLLKRIVEIDNRWATRDK